MIPYGREQIITGAIPSKSNSYRTSKTGGFYTNDKVKNYSKDFWVQCDVYRNKGINVPFSISVDVYFKTAKSDLDGCFKILLDCLQFCGAIMNDNLCYEISARKHIDSLNPRIVFNIKPF